MLTLILSQGCSGCVVIACLTEESGRFHRVPLDGSRPLVCPVAPADSRCCDVVFIHIECLRLSCNLADMREVFTKERNTSCHVGKNGYHSRSLCFCLDEILVFFWSQDECPSYWAGLCFAGGISDIFVELCLIVFQRFLGGIINTLVLITKTQVYLERMTPLSKFMELAPPPPATEQQGVKDLACVQIRFSFGDFWSFAQNKAFIQRYDAHIYLPIVAVLSLHMLLWLGIFWVFCSIN